MEVWDADPHPPVLVDAGDLGENGRGLLLVTALAKAWDYYPSDSPIGGKVVWAEIDLPVELARHMPAITSRPTTRPQPPAHR
ncbi:ATP-binding protein [Actinoallomurus purpureus]|uniref:ATP-binding protein n=1 Tax=Actinoallomurus purpureus TaxID=478114 RepID=UPI00209299CF|nr:ATP-binding protein [Actinoallomurus purpureus]MCO6008829.1 ATP-binding protein [Actinoallomurus purpureus]